MKIRALGIVFIKRLILVLFVVLVLVVGLFFLFFDSIGQAVLKNATDDLPGNFTVKTLSPSFKGVKMSGVKWTLDSKEPVFEASSIDLDLSLGELGRRDWYKLVRSVKIRKPGLRVTVDPRGNLNLLRLLPKVEDPSAIDITSIRTRVDFEEGWIVYKDQRGSGFLYELTSWEGSFVLADGRSVQLASSGFPNGARDSLLTMSGKVALGEPEMEANLAVKDLNIEPFTGFPGFGTGRTYVRGFVNASVRVTGAGASWTELLANAFLVGDMSLEQGAFRAPGMPASFTEMEGRVKMLGSEISTQDFQGKLADISFVASGKAGLGADSELNAEVKTERFPLSKLQPLLQEPLPVEGEAEADVRVSGKLSSMLLSGQLRGYDLTAEGETVKFARSDFLKSDDLVYLSEIEALTSAGTVTGEGWVFLGEEVRVLFSLEGRDTQPEMVMPGIARSANFDLKLMGDLQDPFVYGHASFFGLGQWAQGLSQAEGSFVYSGQDLLLYDGQASAGSSLVDLRVGTYDIHRNLFSGIVSADNFRVEDVPGIQGISGIFSGSALVSADLSGDSPQVQAQASLTSGNFSTGDLAVSEASGEFFYNGAQVLIPWAKSTFEGSQVELSGTYDTRNSGLRMSLSSPSFHLGPMGLPNERAQIQASLEGYLDGPMGVYGVAKSDRGEVALSAYQESNGQLAGVAWVDGRHQGVDVKTVVVAKGTMSDLAMEYNGQISGPQFEDLGPLELSGAANLAGSELTVRPTLIAAPDAPSDSALYPLTTYSGAAYSFFGPLMSGPLQKVVIEESPFPTSRSLLVAGGAQLGTGELDLNFQLRAAGLEDAPFPEQMERLPFELLSGFGQMQGRVLGSLTSPKVEGNFLFPWLLLSDRKQDRLTMGAKGRMELALDVLRIPNLLVSQDPFDSRLTLPGPHSSSEGLLSMEGFLRRDQSFDARLKTAGFSTSFLAFFAPEQLKAWIPSGRLATDSLHLWGTVAQPSIAGRVLLEEGGLMVAGSPYPIHSAFVDFSSQGGEIRMSQLGLTAPGLKVTGSGTRRAGGQLEGSIVAEDIELNKLRRFDGLFAGLEGRADVVANLGGRFPFEPTLELGVRGKDLSWNPAVLGGLSSIVPIEQFVLGVFEPESSRLISGMTIAPSDQGLFFEIPENGFIFERSQGGLKMTASGAVNVPLSGLLSGRFETFGGLADYLASPQGPDFGRQGRPFRLAISNLSTAEASLISGRGTQGVALDTSFEASLEGQWWRDHQLSAGDSLPHYRLTFEKLFFEDGTEERRSGIQLDSVASLDYQRQGEAGYLSVEDWRVGFFREQAPSGENEQKKQVGEADPEALIFRQGVVDAAGRLAISRVPGTEPVSQFQLTASDIPLANLGFLLPESLPLSGLLEYARINLDGVLPSPRLLMEGLATDLTFGPLSGMRLEGSILASELDGVYRIIVGEGEGEEEVIALTFADNDPDSHGAKIDGEVDIDWVKDGEPDPDRLELFAKNIGVSLESPIRLTAALIDKNLEALSDIVPGEVTATGTLQGQLAATGTLRRPEFEGSATLDKGRFISESYGRFENLHLDAKLNRIAREDAIDSEVLQASTSGFLTRFQLEKFEGLLGGQPFFGGGIAEFAGIAPTFLDLFFIGESLPIRMPNLFVGQADIDLELTGRVVNSGVSPTLRPVLSGLMIFPHGDFHIPLGAVDTTAGSTGPSLPMDIVLDLSLGQEFFVRALTSRVRAVGDLQLRTVDGLAQLFGRTQLSRGTIRIPFYDASFRVRQGAAIFDGPFIPRLEDVEAVADLGGYRITARANGRYPDTFDLQLYSNPPLPQAELNRIAVLGGLPATFSGNTDPNQGTGSLGSLSDTGVSFLSGILTNRLTEQIGNLLFLSELSFDYIPPATYAIKVAKALDPNDRILLTLTRVIRDSGLNENLYGIEWRFTQTLLVRTAFDQLSRFRFWLQSINRF